MSQPFYFFVVVWGRDYTSSLLKYCFRTLLAPGNLPALNYNEKNKLLIVTTDEDWGQITESLIFKELAQFIAPIHIKFTLPSLHVSIYDHMSLGHELATMRAFNDRAYGVMLTPDLMLSDGCISAVQSHAVRGTQVVLAAALRYGMEPFFRNLNKLQLTHDYSLLVSSQCALSITGRELAYAAVNSFHLESLRFEWDASYFSPFSTGLPGVCFWRIPAEDGVLLHCGSWIPLLIDYAALTEHDVSTLRYWAIDGDYIFRNFGLDSRVHIVQDSDEIMIVSWTPMTVIKLPGKSRLLRRMPNTADFIKGSLLRDAFLGPYSDPLRRKLFRCPVRIHSYEVNEKWAVVEERASDILAKYLIDCDGSVRFIVMRIIGFTNRIWIVFLGRCYNLRNIARLVLCVFGGDLSAWYILQRRLKLYWRQMFG